MKTDYETKDMEPEEVVVVMEYTGEGYMPGIPTRDLTADDVKLYGGVKRLLSTGLYKMKAKPDDKAHPKKTTEKKEGE